MSAASSKETGYAVVTVTGPGTGEVVWSGTVGWDQVARCERAWSEDMGMGRRRYRITVAPEDGGQGR